jgi:hypothetical protein
LGQTHLQLKPDAGVPATVGRPASASENHQPRGVVAWDGNGGYDRALVGDSLNDLVHEVMEITRAEAPEVLAEDAPVLRAEAMGEPATDGDGFYLIGLIGGKEVGKSALVNALAGREITERTGWGRGTEIVIAYAHQSQAEALRGLLEAEAAGRYRIVTHEVRDLRRQVLLDLPDIDSQYPEHIDLTRRMLRHMLFPVWIQSIEKYADQQPQKLLAAVAAGNDPGNFLFCLNKADQVAGAEDSAHRIHGTGMESARSGAAEGTVDVQRPTSSAQSERSNPEARPLNPELEEVREDFAGRLGRTLRLSEPPRVFVISALRRNAFDLPQLRELLGREKSGEVVRSSRELARRQRARSLLQWLEGLGLSQQAERLRRLEEDAAELVQQRIGVPLLEQVVPRLMDDPAHRLAMVDAVMQKRVSRWPIVNVLHVVLGPLVGAWRRSVGARETVVRGAEATVGQHLESPGRPLHETIRSTFAQLRQAHPLAAEVYSGGEDSAAGDPDRRMVARTSGPGWASAIGSEHAEGELRRSLAACIERQRAVVVERIGSRGGVTGAPFRWLLTIGAVLWFPIVQPVLEAVMLGAPFRLAVLLVQVLGATYLLRSAAFLAIWFSFLWLVLKWDSHRRVARLMERWRTTDALDPTLALPAVVLEWLEGLLEPVRSRRERVEGVVERVDRVREELAQGRQPAAGAAA